MFRFLNVKYFGGISSVISESTENATIWCISCVDSHCRRPMLPHRVGFLCQDLVWKQMIICSRVPVSRGFPSWKEQNEDN